MSRGGAAPGPASGRGDGPLAAALIDALLEEAVAVAEDAREWLARRAAEPPRGGRPALEVLVEARETSRLASRAAHCVAWLLARKAVARGELDPSRAAEPAHRLADQAVCLDETGAQAPLPPRLLDLLERSARLYRRIERLDRTLEPA